MQWEKKALWLTTILVGALINLEIGIITLHLKLPLYLDTIGTLLVTILVSISAGIITGLLSALLGGVLISSALTYYIGTHIVIAIFAGLMAKNGFFQSMSKTVVTGLLLGVAAGVVSAPVTLLFFGGTTGSGADGITLFLLTIRQSLIESVFLSNFAIESLDKTLQCLLVFWLIASPPALHRGLSCLIAIFGTMMANTISLLLTGLLVVLVLLGAQKKLHEFTKFGFTVLLPIGTGLILIWGFIRQGGPGAQGERSVEAGILFAILTILRLALLGAIFLAAVLTLSPERLIHLLQTFGIRDRALAIIVSVLNLWPDFQHHVEQIYAARCARGLMPDRRFLTRMRQLPHAVRTLFISAITYSLDRADAWESSGLLDRLDRLGDYSQASKDCSRIAGFLLLALSIAWAMTALLYFFNTEWIFPIS